MDRRRDVPRDALLPLVEEIFIEEKPACYAFGRLLLRRAIRVELGGGSVFRLDGNRLTRR